MKKLIIILAALAAIASACNSESAQPVTPSPTPITAQPTTQTYTNATYGFEFTYPVTMPFVTPTYPNLEEKIVQLEIPQSAYPGTNFGDAAFSVSAQYAKTLADCLKLSTPENGDGFKTKVTLAGTDFYMTNSAGAGAGNFYDSTVYRTLNANGTCLELNETIHTTNIGNYTPGTVSPVDPTDAQNRLNTILNSFHWTK